MPQPIDSLPVLASDPLTLAHRQLLEQASGIAPAVIAARGYQTVSKRAELQWMGFSASQLRTPALLVPLWGAEGKAPTRYQVRPDKPRKDQDGNPIEYELLSGSTAILDSHPSIRSKLADPSVPLMVTEGVRKADAAVSKGLCCIGLQGVWGWKKPIHDWTFIALKGREVLIAFDSNLTTDDDVRRAADGLKKFLVARGAVVRFVVLRPTTAGGRLGLDDFFAAGGTVEELSGLVTDSLMVGSDARDAGAPRYVRTAHGLSREVMGKKGEPFYIPLTNFHARIVAEITLTDGADSRKEFEVEAESHGVRAKVTLRAEEFNKMDWVTALLGVRAVIFAAPGTREHARAAIQLNSIDELVDRTIYEHTGWVKIEDEWWYLHAGGAIGADPSAPPAAAPPHRPQHNACDENDLSRSGPIGLMGTVLSASTAMAPETRLEGPLALYRLPEPPTREECIVAVRKSLKLLKLVPDRIGMPLFAATYRAPLGDNHYSMALEGLTGRGKTTLLSLFQQHYGPDMDWEHPPASWKSTPMFLEALAHRLKDAALLVDDWVARGSRSDVEKANRDADNFLRSVANGSGRGRCDRDGRPRMPKPPRCLVMTSQEDSPEGSSLAARVCRIVVEKLEIHGPDRAKLLAACQRDAADGEYATAMAGFLRWLAGNLEHYQSGFDSRRTKFRNRIRTFCSHLRTATIAADLIAGFEVFLDFAFEIEAIDNAQYKKYWKRMDATVIAMVEEQGKHLAEQDPVEEFFELLHAALVSGRCHLEDQAGGEPEDAGVWGWRAERYRVNIGEIAKSESPDPGMTNSTSDNANWEERTRWRAQGEKIGWVRSNHLLLIPKAAIAAVQDMSRAMGQHFILNSKNLGRHLDERGKLSRTEPKRKKKTVRHNVAKKRHEVLEVEALSVMRPEFNGQFYDEWDYDGPPLNDLIEERDRKGLTMDDLLDA